MTRYLLLVWCCGFMMFAGIAKADNWPAWRGPTRDGISTEKGLATKWAKDTNIAWKVEMPGAAGSTPIVWGDRIFLTSSDGDQLVLVSLNTSGKKLWQKSIGAATRGKIRRDEANQASNSPSTDGKFVYAMVGSGDFACFDYDGKEIWKFNAQDRYGKFQIQHGIHTTPLLYKDRLYLTLLHANAHVVVALDKKTGNEVWQVTRKTDARGESKECYTSPCLWHEGDTTAIVVLGCDYITAHDIKDGREIWRIGGLNPPDNYMFAFRIFAWPVAS